MNLLFTIIITLVTQNIFAGDLFGPSQFSGTWTGTGTYTKDGVTTSCKTFVLEFSGNNYLMTFLGGERICDTHSEKFVEVAMAYNDGKLYYGNGQEVGSIKDNVLESQFSMPEGNGHIRHWRMKMQVNRDALTYQETRTMDNETTPMISFSGTLKKQD